MLSVKYFLCAESAALDQRRSTLSAFHILENTYAPLFPFLIPRISILAAFERTPEEPSLFPLSLLVTLGEQQVFKGTLAVNFAQQLHTRTVAEIGGLLISSPGKLKFSLFRDKEELASWVIAIERLNIPGMEQLPFPTQPD
jgi:hypothetical protein